MQDTGYKMQDTRSSHFGVWNALARLNGFVPFNSGDFGLKKVKKDAGNRIQDFGS